MARTMDLWTPPTGMLPLVVSQWRSFYRQAIDLYGVKPSDYRLMYIAQKGRCWICRIAKGIHPDDPKGGGTRRLGIDHNHVTGEFRGLLCTGGDKTCNRIIGWLGVEALRRAMEYLVVPPARVLRQVHWEIDQAERAGAQLMQWEIDKLAQAYLWDA